MKKVYKKFISVLSVILMLGFSVVSCSNKTDDTVTKVRLNEVVRSVFYAPMYVAIANGYFEDEGIEIDLSTGHGEVTHMQ